MSVARLEPNYSISIVIVKSLWLPFYTCNGKLEGKKLIMGIIVASAGVWSSDFDIREVITIEWFIPKNVSLVLIVGSVRFRIHTNVSRLTQLHTNK